MADRSYGAIRSRRWGGPLVGLLATGAGLAAAELVVGIVDASTSPVVAVGEQVIDVVPPGPREWAIETFGTSDKAVLVLTTLAILALAGVACGSLAVNGRRLAGTAGVIAVGAVGVAAVIAQPDPNAAKIAPIVVGTVASLAVLWWLAPRPATEPADGAAPTMPGEGAADRRVFIRRTIGVAAVAAVAGGLGRLLQRRYSIAGERAALALPRVVGGQQPAAVLPPNADHSVEGLSPFVTPNADFYRIDTAILVPQVSREDWRLHIHGMVERELELTFDDLLSRDQIEAYVTLACVSNPTGGPYVGNALWQGVRLADLFAEVGVDPESTQLLSTSVDGWTCGTPVSSVTDGRNALLAIAMNGEPLPPEHGYPVRMVVPGEYGYVSATKWVVDMEFTTWDDADAYWVPRGWAEQAPMKTMTRIEVPRHRARVAAGRVQIAGTSYAVHRGISAVEVRVDGGEWMRAELAGVPSVDTWRKWVVEWDAEPGEHEIEARSTDGFGVTETDDVADVVPDGASGYDVVPITVE